MFSKLGSTAPDQPCCFELFWANLFWQFLKLLNQGLVHQHVLKSTLRTWKLGYVARAWAAARLRCRLEGSYSASKAVHKRKPSLVREKLLTKPTHLPLNQRSAQHRASLQGPARQGCRASNPLQAWASRSLQKLSGKDCLQKKPNCRIQTSLKKRNAGHHLWNDLDSSAPLKPLKVRPQQCHHLHCWIHFHCLPSGSTP